MRILFFLFLTINLMGQTPPRVTFKQIQKDTLTGSIAVSGLDSNLTYSRNFYISADSFLILYGDTVGQGSLNAILVDGVTILGDGVNTNLSADTNLIKDIIGAMVNAGLGIDVNYDNVNKELLIESLSIEDLVHNGTGTQIDKGTPLYAVGVQGNYWSVAPADAGDIAKLPVVAIAGENIAAGTEGLALIKGHIKDVNTSTFSAGDEVYVAVGGGYTNVKPKGESNYIQYLGTVIKADANGSGIINLGEVESNLNPGRIFIGGADSTITRVTLKDSISAVVGDSLASNVVRSITAGTFLSGGTITTSGTIALDTASAGLKTYISDNSAGGTTFNNLSETADTVFVSKFLNVDTATLYVDAVNNRVGIGTKNPGFDLYIKNNNSITGFYVENENSGPSITERRFAIAVVDSIGNNLPLIWKQRSIFEAQTLGGIAFGSFYADIDFITSSSRLARMTIKENGNVGIGTTSPSVQLELSTDGAKKLTTTTWQTGSDRRIKKNIVPYTKGLTEILQLDPIEYELNGKANTIDGAKGIGLIAQEVQPIVPEAVITYQGKLNETDEYLSNLYNITTHPFFFMFINGFKEQQAIIETQQSEIDQLKTLITDLTNRLINLENK